MNCTKHLEVVSTGACANCLQPFCGQCMIRVGDRQVCVECLSRDARPSRSASSAAGAGSGCSPGTAFAVGLIPGVGAICNGEYPKAFVHVLIFGFLVSLSGSSNVGSFGPLFGLMTTAFFFYMPLEAYHTAKRRSLFAAGLRLDERPSGGKEESLWVGIILTVMGCLLFVNQWVEGFLERTLNYWPVVLIGFGAHRIWRHLNRTGGLEAGK